MNRVESCAFSNKVYLFSEPTDTAGPGNGADSLFFKVSM